MQFTIPATAFMAFVSGDLGQVAGFDTITKPEKGEVVGAGETYTIVWTAAPAEYNEEAVSIILLAGDSPTTLVPGDEPIAAGVVNSDGQYEWDVPATLGDDKTYGFRIQLESDEDIFQYSFPFEIKAGEGVPSDGAHPSASGADDSSKDPKPTASSTAEPPKSTASSTSVEKPTQEPEEPEKPETEEPETEEPNSGAAANGAMGTVALVGALAAAVFAF